MTKLADALRGYQPPTTSALADPIVEHFRNLPQTLATNQQAMDNTMAGMYKTDMGTGQPNPNYRPEAMNEFTQMMPMVGALTAWHGTPHTIKGAFDISKVGTGEGAQAYGHGMYFAESPKVAESYAGISPTSGSYPPMRRSINGVEVEVGTPEAHAATLLNANGMTVKKAKDLVNSWINDPSAMSAGENTIARWKKTLDTLNTINKKSDVKDVGSGNLYKVDIPDEHIPKTLNWYESFENQPKDVQEALRNLGPEITFGSGKESVADWLKTTGNLPPHLTKQSGHGIYSELSKQLGGDKQASEYLNNLGIKGIQYENFQIKKGQGGGTNNYVMFEPSDVKILEENGIPTRKELIQQQIDKIE